MMPSFWGTSTRSADQRARRRRTESVFRGAGLGDHGRRVGEGDVGFGRRLKLALEGCGPTFRAFGAYLATRPDLLTARDCVELAALDDAYPPASAAEVQARIAAGAGRGNPLGVTVDGPAVESRLMTQTHRGRLDDGRDVLIKISHPERLELVAAELRLLGRLGRFFTRRDGSTLPVSRLVEDFRTALEARADLLGEAEGLDALRRDALECEDLAAPAVDGRLAPEGILLVEPSAGTPLLAFLDDPREDAGAAREAPAPAPHEDPGAIARRVCAAWLRQLLQGRVVPTEPRPQAITISPEGRVCFTSGPFFRLTVEQRADVKAYLEATATTRPDRAVQALLRGMDAGATAAAEEELTRDFRRMTGLADGGWDLRGRGESLAELLFVHWRTAAGVGCRPRPHLLGLYRGLFSVANAARALEPAGDPLQEALKRLQLGAAMQRFAETVERHRRGDALGKNLAAMAAAFPLMDDVLSRGRFGDRPAAGLAGPEQRPSGRRATALMLALLAVSSSPLWVSAPAGSWGDRAAAAAVLVLGYLLLRAA